MEDSKLELWVKNVQMIATEKSSFLILNFNSLKAYTEVRPKNTQQFITFLTRAGKFESCKDNNLSAWMFKFFYPPFYSRIFHPQATPQDSTINFSPPKD